MYWGFNFLFNYINQAGKDVGLIMNVEQAQHTNTLNAHRLLKWASSQVKGDELNAKLYHAYFTDSQNLADLATLTNLAEQAGLDKTEAVAMLQSDAFKAESLADENEARAKGIHSVPAFVFNDKYLISGAQPVQVFLQVLAQLQAEESKQPQTLLNGQTCGIDGCE
ncbi:DsbA family protein [Moraxella sp. ZJ142]|uniref:DsbA family oxidoreductase n=1 Tax=Moraxella marmotae TaxID=3344520 RepID=UPI0035D3EA7C